MNGLKSGKWLKFGLSAAIGVFVSACAMPDVRPLEPGQRVELPGVSIGVPQENGWVYTHDVIFPTRQFVNLHLRDKRAGGADARGCTG